jgi:phospholipase C
LQTLLGTQVRFTSRPASVRYPVCFGMSGIDHIVVVMTENRSFDHLLGWHPTAEGEQGGMSYPDASGALVLTAPLAPDYMGCNHPDPDDSWAGSRVA